MARVTCRLYEEGYVMLLDLDANSDLLALDINDRFTFALARTLSPSSSRVGARLSGKPATGPTPSSTTR